MHCVGILVDHIIYCFQSEQQTCPMALFSRQPSNSVPDTCLCCREMSLILAQLVLIFEIQCEDNVILYFSCRTISIPFV